MRNVYRIIAAIVALGLLLGTATVGLAATDLTTRFPGITVRPGQLVTVSLELHNSSGNGETLALETIKLPDGWDEPNFRGGGSHVTHVHVRGDETQLVTLEQTVPKDAKPGTYEIIVGASGPATGTTELPILLHVSDTAPAAARLSAQYPALQGSADATYTFRVTVYNDHPEQQMFSFEADAPAGWKVEFRPAGDSKRVASLPINGNSSQQVDVVVNPDADAPAGPYDIAMTVATGDATATIPLFVEVLGSYRLSLSTPDGRLSGNVTAGKETTLQFVVENTGSSELNGVRLTASAPPEWETVFEPAEIESLAPGETATVTARLTPSKQAIAGDYVMTVRANGPNGASGRAELRLTVRTSTAWGLVGLAIIGLVGGGVTWTFRKYGRR